MKRNLLIVSTMRESSERCKHKMVRPFGDKTMADIMMEKLEALSTSIPTILALCPDDKELWEKAQNYNITIKKRDRQSVTTATKVNDICNFLEDFDFSHVLWLNSSAPFIKIQTILSVIKLFNKNKLIESIHMIKRSNNWFWNKDFEPINMKLNLTRIQESDKIYESVHILHLYNRKHMLETGSYWTMKENDPYFLLVKNDVEFFDVDTEEDFKNGELLCQQ
jgi:CMP-N-acetylneuraminic acid synthetase|tara:strand:+ start:103 stop:768 length:666 start_codon:yes stop_codon:yes gene_type:complete